MGIGMAYVAYKSGSIWVGAIMHFINNGLSVVLQYHPEWIESIPVLGKETYAAADMVILSVVGIVFVVLSIVLMKNTKNKTQAAMEPKE